MATGAISPFVPVGTVSVTASTTSASVALVGAGDSVVVTNATGSLAYVQFGATAATVASSAGMPVLPNSRVMLGITPLTTYAAAVLASGSGTMLLTRGHGSFV